MTNKKLTNQDRAVDLQRMDGVLGVGCIRDALDEAEERGRSSWKINATTNRAQAEAFWNSNIARAPFDEDDQQSIRMLSDLFGATREEGRRTGVAECVKALRDSGLWWNAADKLERTLGATVAKPVESAKDMLARLGLPEPTEAQKRANLEHNLRAKPIEQSLMGCPQCGGLGIAWTTRPIPF